MHIESNCKYLEGRVWASTAWKCASVPWLGKKTYRASTVRCATVLRNLGRHGRDEVALTPGASPSSTQHHRQHMLISKKVAVFNLLCTKKRKKESHRGHLCICVALGERTKNKRRWKSPRTMWSVSLRMHAAPFTRCVVSRSSIRSVRSDRMDTTKPPYRWSCVNNHCLLLAHPYVACFGPIHWHLQLWCGRQQPWQLLGSIGLSVRSLRDQITRRKEPIMSILGSSRVSESRNSHDLKGAKLEAILDVGLAIELDLISNYNSTSLFKIKSWIRFKNRNPYWHSPTKKLLKFCDLIVAMPLHRCISAIYIGWEIVTIVFFQLYISSTP